MPFYSSRFTTRLRRHGQLEQIHDQTQRTARGVEKSTCSFTRTDRRAFVLTAPLLTWLVKPPSAARRDKTKAVAPHLGERAASCVTKDKNRETLPEQARFTTSSRFGRSRNTRFLRGSEPAITASATVGSSTYRFRPGDRLYHGSHQQTAMAAVTHHQTFLQNRTAEAGKICFCQAAF